MRPAEAIPAVDRLRPLVSPAVRLLLTHGTGAMEKNIATGIGRRFQRGGLRWTRRGAPNLLQLRLGIARGRTPGFEALHLSRAPRTNA